MVNGSRKNEGWRCWQLGPGRWTSAGLRRAVPGGANLSLQGSANADEIQGLAGLDDIYGNGGDDRLYGGADSDLIDGGTGNDLLDGGTGPDDLIGEAGADNDLLYVGDLLARVVLVTKGTH